MQSNECMYICDQFTEYHENTLEPEVRAKVETHLTICQSCQKTFINLASLLQTLHQLPSMRTSPNFTADLLQKINTSPQESPWYWIARSSYVRVAGYAIAAGLLVAIGLNIWLDPISPVNPQAPRQFTVEKEVQSDAPNAMVGFVDSAGHQVQDSLEIQQTIQSGTSSLQLVNSSK